MLKKIAHPIIFLIAFMHIVSLNAQLPNGSKAPNFIATDINGVEYELYDLLAQGYTVVLDISATWCDPCWEYHSEGALEELHSNYGPTGTDEIFVLLIEADDATDLDDLNGIGGNTAGNWVANTNYPIIDNGGEIAACYEIAYYPTIFTIGQNGNVYESGQASTDLHHAFASNEELEAKANDASLWNFKNEEKYCAAPFNLGVYITNVGTEPLSNAEISYSGCAECPLTINWTGNLGHFESEWLEITINEAAQGITPGTFSITNPDDNLANNDHDSPISLSSVDAYLQGTVVLVTDCWPEETSWDIKAQDGSVVASGGNYNIAEIEYNINFTFPEVGWYVVTLYDSFGDGLNGSGSSSTCGSNGSFSIFTDAGIIMEEDGTTLFNSITENASAQTPSNNDGLADLKNIEVFPNPSSNYFTLSLKTKTFQAIQLQLINSIGQVVLAESYNNSSSDFSTRINTSNLPKGMYLMEVSFGEEKVLKKIIVQ